ncbi:MAG: hypothetical protein IPI30_04210 [Saprospiraceae bacterium]|nr:hypothetical protein [Candidatus Vicinibacter affinis]
MEYYFEPRDITYVRGQGTLSALDSAKLAFNSEEYTKSLEILNQMPGSNPDQDYFRANIYFKLGQFDKSNKLFNLCLAKEKDQFKREEIESFTPLNNLPVSKMQV